MVEMPLLVVAILSPRQGAASILAQFKADFALGISSRWLVAPLTQTVHVYQSAAKRTTFSIGSTGEVVVPSLDIYIPIAEIFGI